MTRVVRLLIVDDHPVVRDGLRGMLAAEPGLDVVGEAADGDEALALVASLRPDVVLMDLRMPRVDGVRATQILRARHPEVRVLVLTTYDTEADVVRAVEAGATGYLLKDAGREELVQAVRAAAAGRAVLAPTVASRLLEAMRPAGPDTPSTRELEVLELVARGCSNREAAAALYISEATVKTHLLHLFAKLGVNDRTAAVRVALQRGLITL